MTMKLKKILRSSKGEGMIGGAAILLFSCFAIALAFHLFPVFLAKQQLDTYAGELCRTAEMAGRVGPETAERERELTANTGLSPKITWSRTGDIQLGQKITVTCTVSQDIGRLAGVGSVPVPLTSRSSGKSEVYWK